MSVDHYLTGAHFCLFFPPTPTPEKRQCLREERTQLELQVAHMSSLLQRPSIGILEDLASPPRQSCG